MTQISKYKNEWKEFSMNEAFWTEVLVGRYIRSARYEGTVTATCQFNDKGRLRELHSKFSLELGSGEIVYLAGEPDWGQLDLIAPAPHGPVGQHITALEWDKIGLSALVLDVGRITLDKEKAPGRLWIKDGVKLKNHMDVVMEEMAESEDRRFLEQVEVAIAAKDES